MRWRPAQPTSHSLKSMCDVSECGLTGISGGSPNKRTGDACGTVHDMPEPSGPYRAELRL